MGSQLNAVTYHALRQGALRRAAATFHVAAEGALRDGCTRGRSGGRRASPAWPTGALVAWAGGDWKTIDPAALDAFLQQLSGYRSRVRCQEVSTQEALRAISALETEAAESEDGGEDE